MTQDINLTSSVVLPASGEKPESLVILLHGLGSNGDDLIGLVPEWQDALPTTAFVSPNAPFPCDMAPYGFQWFSLQSRDPQDMLAGIIEAQPILDRFIDEQLEHFGLTEDRLALIGFSQGTMMSLYTAPRRKQPCAGILGYSGALLENDNAPILSKPPICLIHGDADPVVPLEASKHGHNQLKEQGFSVDLHVRPHLPHSIDQEGIDIGRAFLTKIFKSS